MDDAPPATTTELVVRRARPGDVATLVQVLARAFDRDPFYNWILPQGRRRAASFDGMFELILTRMADNLAETFTTGDVAGCAIWKRPGTHKLSLFRQAQLLPAFAKIIGLSSIPRGLRIVEHMDALHERFAREPHVYLYVLGVDPTAQRRGLGSRLLEPGLLRCDRERHRVYLETARAENVAFYERQGFKLELEARHAEFPTFWAMTRAPR
jgi:ribosomal protein S18 acetylase RimI-like enzyme